jgi:predicted MFS family arabinose efflux permease
VNLSYAKLQMTDELRFSDAVYGFGAGIFFIGYVLLEIPGTLLVERWSARLWISRIMVTWGVIATLMGFVHTVGTVLYAAFSPGIGGGRILSRRDYLSDALVSGTAAEQAISLFMIGSPVANVLGSPSRVDHGIYTLVSAFGWRWVFHFGRNSAVLIGS